MRDLTKSNRQQLFFAPFNRAEFRLRISILPMPALNYYEHVKSTKSYVWCFTLILISSKKSPKCYNSNLFFRTRKRSRQFLPSNLFQARTQTTAATRRRTGKPCRRQSRQKKAPDWTRRQVPVLWNFFRRHWRYGKISWVSIPDIFGLAFLRQRPEAYPQRGTANMLHLGRL